MDEENSSLFSKKELWRMAHDARGNSYLLKTIPQAKRRKIMDDNMHLMDGMSFSNGYPILKAYNGPTDFSLISFTDRKKYVLIILSFISFLTIIAFEMPCGTILNTLPTVSQNLIMFLLLIFLFGAIFKLNIIIRKIYIALVS